MEEGMEYWKCPKCSPYCPGRAHVQVGWEEDEIGRYKMVTQGHNHQAVFRAQMVKINIKKLKMSKKQIREAQEQLRQAARADYPGTSREVVSDVRSNLSVEVRAKSAPVLAAM